MDKQALRPTPSMGFGLSMTSSDEAHSPDSPAPTSFLEYDDSNVDGKAKRPREEAGVEPKTKRVKAASGKNPRAKVKYRGMSQKMANGLYQQIIKPRNLGVEAVSGSAVAGGKPFALDEIVEEREGVSLGNALLRFKDRILPSSASEGPYLLQGISSPLSPIQITTIHWMIGRESSRGVHGQGGILAHGMGVGKTLMALGLMIVNKTGLTYKKNKGQCATLVIAPSDAVIEHWLEECWKHASEFFPSSSMARYRDLRKLDNVEAIRQYKVV